MGRKQSTRFRPIAGEGCGGGGSPAPPHWLLSFPSWVLRIRSSCGPVGSRVSLLLLAPPILFTPVSSWFLLAPPGSSWLLQGSSSSWLAPPAFSWLLTPPGFPGSSWLPWLLLALPGSSWLLLAPPGPLGPPGPWLLLGPPGLAPPGLAPPVSSWLRGSPLNDLNNWPAYEATWVRPPGFPWLVGRLHDDSGKEWRPEDLFDQIAPEHDQAFKTIQSFKMELALYGMLTGEKRRAAHRRVVLQKPAIAEHQCLPLALA